MHNTLFFSHLSNPFAIVIGVIVGILPGLGIGAFYFNTRMHRAFNKKLRVQRNIFLTPTRILVYRAWIVVGVILLVGFNLFYLQNAGWGLTFFVFFLASILSVIFIFILVFFIEIYMERSLKKARLKVTDMQRDD